MDKAPARIAAIVAIVVLIVPAAAAQSAPQNADDRKTAQVTFFGHVFDVGRANPMPMNTEFPSGEEDLSAGYGGTCQDTLPEVAAPDPVGRLAGTCEVYAFNEAWFISSAGFVDVSTSDEFAYEKMHNERGLTKPIIFDTAQPVLAHWYMSADAHGWPVVVCNPGAPDLDDVPWAPICFNWDPGMLPQWQVESTLYAAVLGEHGTGASEAGDIEGAYTGGKLEVIAQGVSAPVDITSLEAAGFPTVWEFEINMGPAKMKEIPKEKSLIWRTQWYALLNGQRTLEDNLLSWNVNSGEFFPDRVILPVKNAFDVELVLPQFLHNKLVVHGIVNTPWGSYDADPESVRLTVTNRDGTKEAVVEHVETYADYSVAHGGHYRPVNVTYVWDYSKDKLAPGEYKAVISAANHQASATASCEALFKIHGDGTGEVLQVGRCGTVSSGAEAFAAKQGGNATAGSDLLQFPGLAIRTDAARAVPSPAGLLAASCLAVAAVAARRRWGE